MSDQLLDPSTNIGPNDAGVLPNATATLVLGIISLVGCFLWGLPGLICGIIGMVLHKKDKQLYLSNPAKYEASFKTAKAGNTCSLIGVILSTVMFVIMIGYFIFIFAFLSTAGPIFNH